MVGNTLRIPRVENVKKYARAAGLAALILLGLGCSEDTSEPNQTVKTSQEGVNDHQTAERLWSEAIHELNEKIKNKQSIDFLVAKDTCITWTTSNEGIVTVIRNPLIYKLERQEGDFYFYPFISSSPDGPALMNGPYEFAPAGQDGVTITYGIAQADREPSFEPVTLTAAEIIQASQPEVFPPAWLESNGLRFAETRIIEEANIQDAFPETCLFGVN